MNNLKKAVNKIINNKLFTTLVPTIIAIILGLFVGYIVLLITRPNIANEGFKVIMLTGLGYDVNTGHFINFGTNFGYILYLAAPLLLLGVSVGIAYKCGLFNIGASGQFLVGGFFAFLGALVFKTPWYVNILFATFGGLIWGLIPGLFKAYLNVNEVITTIMLNWIGLFLVTVLLANIPGMLGDIAGYDILTKKIELVNSNGIIPHAGLDKLFNSSYMSVSILIAILIALVIYLILYRSVFGYKLQACGYNKHAANYAGINSKRYIVYTMLIAGALAGAAGGLFYLDGQQQLSVGTPILPNQGFDGIAIALLGSNNPFGIIFSGVFISYLKSSKIQMQSIGFAEQYIDLIISVILYFSALSLFFKKLLDKRKFNRINNEKTKVKEGTK